MADDEAEEAALHASAANIDVAEIDMQSFGKRRLAGWDAAL